MWVVVMMAVFVVGYILDLLLRLLEKLLGRR